MQQQHPQQHQSQPTGSPPRMRFSLLHQITLIPLLASSCVVGPPAFLLGWSIQRYCAASSWDYKERWTGIWIFALICAITYLLLAVFAHSLAFVMTMLVNALLQSTFLIAGQWVFLLWGLNLLFSPLLALFFEAIAPITQTSLSLPNTTRGSPAPPALPSVLSSGLSGPTVEAINGKGVIGLALEGDLTELMEDRYFTYPLPVLLEHGLIIGMSGMGKSELLNRIGYFARRSYGMKVIRIDGKGDWRDMAKFKLAMLAAGASSVHCYPVEQHNGWYGNRQDILFRLLSCQTFEHSFYAGVCYNMLRMALYAPNVPPVSSGAELLKRLWPGQLMALYRGRSEYQYLQGLPPDALWGPYGRYNALFSVVGDRLDGTKGFGDADCSYYLLDQKRLQLQIGTFAKLLLDDFELYLSLRGHVIGSPRILLLIDDYSAFSEQVSIFDLIERLRSAGVAVLAAAHGFNSLAATPLQARRLLEGGGSLLLHRCTLPKELLEAVATHEVPDLTIRYNNRERDEYGFTTPESINVSMSMREEPTIHPNEIKGLGLGEIFFVHGTAHQRVAVERLPLNPEEVEDVRNTLTTMYDQATQTYEMTQLTQSVVPPLAVPPRKPQSFNTKKGGGGASPTPKGVNLSAQPAPPGQATSSTRPRVTSSPGNGVPSPARQKPGVAPASPQAGKANPKITRPLTPSSAQAGTSQPLPSVPPSPPAQGLSLSDLN